MFELKKIGIVKRASALLLDAILLAVLATGFMWLISLACNFSGHQKIITDVRNDFRKNYIADVAEYYGFEYREYEDEESGERVVEIMKDGEESSLTEVEQALIDSEGNDPETKEAYDAYVETVAKVRWETEFIMNMLFMMISVSTLLAYLILEFIVPIILKNGQTVGKKVFGICLVRPDCVKVGTLALFARTVLGKYAVETMFPVLLVFLFFVEGFQIFAMILFAALVFLNVILFFATKNRTPLHDIFASTVAADMNLQMIYPTEEALIEAKKASHKEEVENSKG